MIPSITRNAAPPEELLARLGRTFEEYRGDVEYLASHRDELTNLFPDQWIAVFDGRVVASSGSAEGLTPKLRKKSLQRAHAVIDYLFTKPVNLIL
jgi:hypothetical protein